MHGCHSGPVNGYASGSNDKAIRLCDVKASRERATLRGHSGYVTSVAFTFHGKTLASVSGGLGEEPAKIKLWDLAAGKKGEQ